ncbi:MAG TPA: hypothetical protein VEY14_13650, partial [Nocardioidaceae bacterium]|nr:hypothetical protein [Nocardioidaceae bacterium]
MSGTTGASSETGERSGVVVMGVGLSVRRLRDGLRLMAATGLARIWHGPRFEGLIVPLTCGDAGGRYWV